jgi:hypothetical protein
LDAGARIGLKIVVNAASVEPWTGWFSAAHCLEHTIVKLTNPAQTRMAFNVDPAPRNVVRVMGNHLTLDGFGHGASSAVETTPFGRMIQCDNSPLSRVIEAAGSEFPDIRGKTGNFAASPSITKVSNGTAVAVHFHPCHSYDKVGSREATA